MILILVFHYDLMGDFCSYVMQAQYAQSSVSVGLKGASKAMEAMNKVAWFITCLN